MTLSAEHERHARGEFSWREARGTGSGVGVAVIDSGWDSANQDARVLPGTCFVDDAGFSIAQPSTDYFDEIGHGTACANLVLAVAPECHILPIRVFRRVLQTSPATLVRSINWAADREIRVVNLSLTTLRVDAIRSLYAACERARRKGTIVVAASRVASNDLCFPASFDSVISVGTRDARKPDAMEYSPASHVECHVLSTKQRVIGLRGARLVGVGNSFAAPIVTGVVARWISNDFSLSVDGVRELFREHALVVSEDGSRE